MPTLIRCVDECTYWATSLPHSCVCVCVFSSFPPCTVVGSSTCHRRIHCSPCVGEAAQTVPSLAGTCCCLWMTTSIFSTNSHKFNFAFLKFTDATYQSLVASTDLSRSLIPTHPHSLLTAAAYTLLVLGVSLLHYSTQGAGGRGGVPSTLIPPIAKPQRCLALS